MVSITRIAAGLARARTGALVLSLAGLLGACASLTPEPPAATSLTVAGAQAIQPASPPPSATPRQTAPTGGRYKVGAPYQAGGVWYVPAEQPTYDEVGLASWYGDGFDGKPTANGEVFDMHGLSAAHATLPMPCTVEVTNLDNGRVIQVRMNDRGPFHPGRIIDMSHAAADQLGFAAKGTARVRVRYVGPAPLQGMAAPVTLASATRVGDVLPAPRPIPSYQITPPPLRSAATTTSPASPGRFVVQAGAFSTRDAAERVATRVAAAGAASVKPLSRGGATLYKVTVGIYDDAAAANAARGRVAALGFDDARVAPGF
jgi:rare lipoprotein A